MSLALEARHLRMVQAILQARAPDLRVLAYGSRSRGDAVAHSHLDLLIDSDSPVDELLLAQLSLDFADSDLPFRVEIIDGARVDADFRQRIAVDLRPIGEPV